ncbi:hypothetical protein F3N42_03650 [Marinihelvus fidelis]|uniref:Uncharacterized protein n=1 Tax=Marinihelvus fidelis TaxID=2613842 RepID=A0A5N0TH49_9GAMM|nr:phage tail tube protein [Marinihelvus fidelis]KAA9133457.1 hypothetical protein F3N42_03650 [Marinihelvus fidelis]
MLFRKKRILAKIESVYGTDPTPDGSNAILTRNLDIPEVYGGEKVQRNLDRETLGHDESINVEPQVQVSFEVELAGAGSAAVTAGTAPAYGPLLRACGFAESITATTDTQYDPVSASFESVTLYYIMDGNLHILTGCRGNVEFMFPRRGFPYMRFTFWGTYATPTAAGAYTIDTSAFMTPLPVNQANTTLDLDSYSPRAESLSLNMNNEVVNRNIINFDERLIVDRAPSGEIAFEVPEVGSKDVYSDLIESHSGVNKGPFNLVHGTATGNIIELDVPLGQFTDLNVSDSDGVALGTGPYNALPSDTGDDEVKLTVR